MATFSFMAITVVIIAAMFAGYIYVFGLPRDVKREIEEKAFRQLGENEVSGLIKTTLDKVPDSEQEDVQDLKKKLNDAAGGALQDPLGKLTGNPALGASSKEFETR